MKLRKGEEVENKKSCRKFMNKFKDAIYGGYRWSSVRDAGEKNIYELVMCNKVIN